MEGLLKTVSVFILQVGKMEKIFETETRDPVVYSSIRQIFSSQTLLTWILLNEQQYTFRAWMVPHVFNWLPEMILDYQSHELLEAPVDATAFELWSVRNVLCKVKFNHTVTGRKLRETESWQLTGRPWVNTRANKTVLVTVNRLNT